MMVIGSKLPKLTGIIQDDKTLALNTAKNHYTVVYFYPKDNTPGCTREAQDFRELYPKFKKLGCEVIGVSRDSALSHQKFHNKYDLSFPLITDSDEVWCKAFDVLGEKILYGKRYHGVIRSTFLLGPNNTLRAQWRNVKVPGHAQAVLDHLSSL